jgi:hypothetical protein
MVNINTFEPLLSLADDVLGEVVREGERRLDAQLQIATAADQRALTVAGFQIASATAAMGGGVALISKVKPDYPVALLALAFATALLLAAALAVHTVRPRRFNIPGNSPKGWLPENWIGAGKGDFSLRQARMEQAACLADAIADNNDLGAWAAKHLRRSLDLTLYAVGLGAAGLFLTVLHRGWTIEEPNSAIVTTANSAARITSGLLLEILRPSLPT